MSDQPQTGCCTCSRRSCSCCHLSCRLRSSLGSHVQWLTLFVRFNIGVSIWCTHTHGSRKKKSKKSLSTLELFTSHQSRVSTIQEHATNRWSKGTKKVHQLFWVFRYNVLTNKKKVEKMNWEESGCEEWVWVWHKCNTYTFTGVINHLCERKTNSGFRNTLNSPQHLLTPKKATGIQKLNMVHILYGII